MNKLFSTKELVDLVKNGMLKFPFRMKWRGARHTIFTIVSIGVTSDGTEYGLIHLPVLDYGKHFAIDNVKDFTLLDNIQCPWPDYL